MSSRRVMVLSTAVVLAALVGCAPRPVTEPVEVNQVSPGVVVGATASGVSQVLARLYAASIGAQGVPVTLRDDLTGRDEALAGLSDQTVSVVPDFLGALALHLDPGTDATSTRQLRALVGAELPPGLEVGTASSAAGEAAYLADSAFAREQGVDSLDEVSGLGRRVKVGGPALLETSRFGRPGLEQLYQVRGARLETVDDPVERLARLTSGQLDLAYLGPDEAVPAGSDVVRLDDPKHLLPSEAVVPLLRSGVAADSTVTEAVDAVQARLTTRGLRQLVSEVADGRPPADVAAGWVAAQGLDEPTAPEGKRAVFIGDSYTHGVGASDRSRRWTTLVARSEGWQEVNLGLGGTGYLATAGPSGCGRERCASYQQVVAVAVAQQPDVVVVAGGQNDFKAYDDRPQAVEAAVEATYAELRAKLPDAQLVAVGPSTPGTAGPTVRGLDKAVRRAAGTAGARYVSLLSPPVVRPDEVPAGGAHVDDAGHAAIAARVEQALR